MSILSVKSLSLKIVNLSSFCRVVSTGTVILSTLIFVPWIIFDDARLLMVKIGSFCQIILQNEYYQSRELC